MSQSLSWIDPSAFSAALSRAGVDPSGRGPRAAARAPVWAMGPTARPAPQPFPPQPPAPVPRTDAPSAAVAPASVTPQAVTPPPPAAPPSQAAVPTPAPAASASPSIPPLVLDSDRLDKRLESYLAWVEDGTSCRGLFIVDEEGLVLMERESDPNLVALSAYFLNLKDRIPDSLGTRSEGSLAIDLDDERVLHVIQSDTRLGPHALGFTVPSPLHRDLTHRFQESLADVFAATD